MPKQNHIDFRMQHSMGSSPGTDVKAFKAYWKSIYPTATFEVIEETVC